MIQQKTWVVQKRVLGLDHPHTLMTAFHTANRLYEQGKLDEADAIQLETLLAQKRALGEDHPHTINTATSLRRIAAKRKERDSATGGGGGAESDHGSEPARERQRLDEAGEDDEAEAE